MFSVNQLNSFYIWVINYLCLYVIYWWVSLCSEPVHAKKYKNESVIEKYEKIPRRMQTEPQKELIHLLPIKDKHGIIPQTMEKPGEAQLG